jgi:hypothetical protein
MSRKSDSSPPQPEMVKSIDEMLKHLEKLEPDPAIVGTCPELPGIVLDRVLGKVQSREDSDYKEIVRKYNSMRSEYLRALVAHPVGRALALLAVGAEGVAMLEAGRTPCAVSEISSRPQRSLRTRREPYNCHHVIPKSLQVAEGSAAINHPANLVMAKTVRRGRDQSQNPHHCWHGLLLHPQTHNAPPTAIPVYVVRPLFPFYPPITQGFRSADELRNRLIALGAPPLPEVWEKRILEFSKAAKHKAYSVPREFHEITQMFGDLYSAGNKDPINNLEARRALAERSAKQAAEWLPAGAFINGSPLPPSHRPKKCLPIIQSNVASEMTFPEKLKPVRKEPRRRKCPGRKIIQESPAKVQPCQ